MGYILLKGEKKKKGGEKRKSGEMRGHISIFVDPSLQLKTLQSHVNNLKTPKTPLQSRTLQCIHI